MKAIRSVLSRLNFALGNKPRLLKYRPGIAGKFIPSSYSGVLIISCDFELAWAWRFSKELSCDLSKAQEKAQAERKNILKILTLSDKFNIPIVWATVGHLFLKGCLRQDGVAHKGLERPPYFENRYWKYAKGDWFDDDPCCDWQNAQGWYAPDIIRQIINSSVKHEIACHTFSHINCSEGICSAKMLRDELRMCKEAAGEYGIELKSFVFPGNFVGNVDALREEGFVAYRAEKDILGLPQKDAHSLWQIPTTSEIAVDSYNWSIDYHIRKYRTIIDRAIKFNRLCHFWFHPSTEVSFLEKVLGSIFEYADRRRKDIYITTMRDYISGIDII
jgi:peptidoglycan/xylan/chitin deacetylase (PgdA/CDA1 family)